MQRVTLGESGLSVSPVSFGTWQLSPRFWGEQSKEEAMAAMKVAFEKGINFLDTADAYGDGPVQRTITSLAGDVRPGNSGGPLIDTGGHVTATVFAASTTTAGGYATPVQLLATLLAKSSHSVSTGACAD